jgi:hypothetical protein
MRTEETIYRELLHALGERGWQPWGGDETRTRGWRWYQVRLYRDGSSVCPRCGTAGLSTAIKFCPNCGLQRTVEPTSSAGSD